jgi:hypothetical protein
MMNYWNQLLIQSGRQVNEEFIAQHFDQFDHLNLLEHLRKLGRIDIIKKYRTRFRWIAISACQNLSEEFIEEFCDDVNWRYISQYQALSEGFIRKFRDKVNWYMISYHQKLSEEFIQEFEDCVYWNGIFRNPILTLSEEFRQKYQYKLLAADGE